MSDSLKNYWLYLENRTDLTMPSYQSLILKYGEVGAQIVQAYGKVGIADNGGDIFHIHFRGNWDVDDAALQLCRQLPFLTELVLNKTSISDDGISCLSNLERLTILHLGSTAITDSGLIHLSSQPLQTLDLCQTAVSNEGLNTLMLMTTLSNIWLIDTRVSADGVSAFRQYRPNCTVHISGQ